MDELLRRLPKAENHVHIEGTITPKNARALAARNGLTLDTKLFTPDGNGYAYDNFLQLVTSTYQEMANVVRTKQDYEDITYDYLCRSADEGSIYTELIACPGECTRKPISYQDMIDGMAAGIDRAFRDKGIVSRISATFERHRPGAEAERDAAMILSYPHPYVRKIGLAGGEQVGDIPQFMPVMEKLIVDYKEKTGKDLDNGAHAGEVGGAGNVRDALTMSNMKSIEHGIAVINDDSLIEEIKQRDIHLTVCITSNMLLTAPLMAQFKGSEGKTGYQVHPVRRLFDKGVKMTLNTDDPGMFGENCTIGNEYQIAKDEFGFSDRELLQFTRTAIEFAKIDEPTRAKLMQKVDNYDFLLTTSRNRGPQIRPPSP